jgi:hypothetical protein
LGPEYKGDLGWSNSEEVEVQVRLWDWKSELSCSHSPLLRPWIRLSPQSPPSVPPEALSLSSEEETRVSLLASVRLLSFGAGHLVTVTGSPNWLASSVPSWSRRT